MGTPADQMPKPSQDSLAVSDVRVEHSKEDFEKYDLPMRSDGRDMSQREIVRAVVADAIEKRGFTYRSDKQIDEVVDSLFNKAREAKFPVVDWDRDNIGKSGHAFIEPDVVEPRGKRLDAGDKTTYEGYKVRVGPELQADIGNAIEDSIDVQRQSRYKEMKTNVDELRALTEKLDKVAEYSNDHTLHGLTAVYSPLLNNAKGNSEAIKEYIKNQSFLDATDPLDALRNKVADGYEIFKDTNPNARSETGEQIVARMSGLNEQFKQQGEYMTTAISYLPGGGSALAKGIGVILEGREVFNEVASGKVTLQQAVEKRAEKVAIDLVAGTIGKAFGGGKVSDNIGVEKMKEFVSGTASDYIKESAKLYKKGAGADEYKTALADTLLKNFAKTAGGSIKSIAGDDEGMKKVMEAAVKLGIEEPVKKALEAAKKSETKEVSSLVPQKTVDGVRDLKLPTVSTDADVNKVAGTLQATANRENVAVEKVVASNDQANVFGMNGDPNRPGFVRTSAVNVAEALRQDQAQVNADVQRSAQTQSQDNAQVEQRRSVMS